MRQEDAAPANLFISRLYILIYQNVIYVCRQKLLDSILRHPSLVEDSFEDREEWMATDEDKGNKWQ